MSTTTNEKTLISQYMRKARRIRDRLKAEIQKKGYRENMGAELDELAQKVMQDDRLGLYYYRANIAKDIQNMGDNL